VEPLLTFNDRGIYCSKANIYIDAWKPVDKVIVSHAHADHSKYGHKYYLSHNWSVPIIKHRLGNINIEGKDWGEKFYINGVQFSLHPAGHVVGSAQIRIEYQGNVWVYTGDYKREDDHLSTPFQVVKCNTLITECTFGLPAFNWKNQHLVYQEINSFWNDCKSNNQTAVVFAYSLGKAQRLLTNLDLGIGKVYTHGAVENLNEVIRTYKNLPKSTRITRETKKQDLIGSLVIAPPSTNGTAWLKKMVPYVTSSASGWMTFRGARRRRAIDRGFVLSDHCDWKDLIKTIKETQAENIICTHGYKDIFSKYLNENGYNSFIENTPFVETQKEAVNE
jgi:putative mRNA 3-end processing factor